MKTPRNILTPARGTAALLMTATALVVAPCTTVRPARAGVPVGLVAAGASAQSGSGTIKGRLVWGGAEAPAPRPLVEKGQAQKDPAVCAASEAIPKNALAVDPKTKGVKYALAYLVKPKASNPEAVKALLEKNPKVEIDQKNCEFLPYVAGVHQDQAVLFKSSDPVNHNVRLSAFDNASFNLILAPNGSVEKKFVAERRPLPLSCDIHPWMKGYIMVFDHPFFAVTGTDGSFEIKGVSPGTYNLAVWQTYGFMNPGLARGMPVTVTADAVTDVGELKLDPSKVRD